MKIAKTKKSLKRPTLLLAILITILLITGGVFAYMKISQKSNDTPGTTNQQQPDQKPIEEDSIETADTPDSQKPAGPEGNPDHTPDDKPQENLSTQLHIPSHQAQDDTITVHVALDEVWSDGECVMSLKGPTAKTVRTDVFPQARISGCVLKANSLPAGHYEVQVWAERNGQKTDIEALKINL